MKNTLILVVVLAAAMVANAKNGFYPVRNSSVMPAADQAKPAGSSKLLYFGGPVISTVKVVSVMWGSKVNSTTQTEVPGFFTAMSNSTYMDWLGEYDTNVKGQDGREGTNQHIGRGTFNKQVTITPINTAKQIDDSDIQKELASQIQAGALPPADNNTLYMVYFPPGMGITSFGMAACQDFCAYHSFSGTPEGEHFYYGVLPDISGMCGFGCGGSSFNSLSAISAHEYMEAITDPYPTPGDKPAFPQAWNTSDGAEIGDLCTSRNNTLKAPNKNYVVQAEFDNSITGCTTKAWSSPN